MNNLRFWLKISLTVTSIMYLCYITFKAIYNEHILHDKKVNVEGNCYLLKRDWYDPIDHYELIKIDCNEK